LARSRALVVAERLEVGGTEALPPLVAGAVTLVYILGKALGPESL